MMSIKLELERAWQKAKTNPGELSLLSPDQLDPQDSSNILIDLLSKTYTNHAISHDPEKLESDIAKGIVKPWVVNRNNRPIACAALIFQKDGSAEIGRAVSIEPGTGAGKIAMLSAVLSKNNTPLIAEVRLAGEFAGIPGSEATQRICFNSLRLIPHALLFAFAHGELKRREMFAFSSENFSLINQSPITTAKSCLSGRDLSGTPRNLQVIQKEPFRVATPCNTGENLSLIVDISRALGGGFTLIPIEVVDQNLSTVGALLKNDFQIVGLDRKVGESGRPIIYLSTIGKGETLAPSQPSSILPAPLRNDIAFLDQKFISLTRGD